ncbi:hypothetical protein L7F22_061829 [Adiantum nelumboides]|nr:hypothetical protein [Adiantum nelumboides]
MCGEGLDSTRLEWLRAACAGSKGEQKEPLAQLKGPAAGAGAVVRRAYGLTGSESQGVRTCVDQTKGARELDLGSCTLVPSRHLRAVQQIRAEAAQQVTISKLSKEFSLWECLKFYLRNQKTQEQHYPNLHGALMKLEQVSSSREGFEFFLKPRVIEEGLAMGNEFFPGLMRALVHERNEYMVRRLRNLEGNVVAVVGAAHVPGMCELWQEAEAGAELSSASLS